jgi:hypothetical protein
MEVWELQSQSWESQKCIAEAEEELDARMVYHLVASEVAVREMAQVQDMTQHIMVEEVVLARVVLLQIQLVDLVFKASSLLILFR